MRPGLAKFRVDGKHGLLKRDDRVRDRLPRELGEAVLGGGQLLAYAAFAAVGLALVSCFSRGFALPSRWRIALVMIVTAGAICNLVIVASLLAASSCVVVLGGAWLLPIGLAVSAFGVWSSTAR